ncbi:methylase of polypeptide subunit release factors [Agromyces terreus]|uniref:Methylase of polypeptide subunit release factors n=1 Tax=Agromyces terreus TaxID=424795 RepID=A0A9X2KDC3_9MICO|nr:methyltransferase [Agromyces terreus]MCP2372549.1 methylase of polypeptide subunit release factors [Agromyces terreus]
MNANDAAAHDRRDAGRDGDDAPSGGALSTAAPERRRDLLASLAVDLRSARFAVASLDALWGAEAAAALHRGQRVPARRVLEAKRLEHAASAELATLAELFVLGLAVDRDDLGRALPALGVDGAIELGLVGADAVADDPVGELGRARGIRPLLDLRPYAFVDAHGAGEWWILSDLGELALGHALGEHHVLGVGGASMTLSGLMMPDAAGSVLDLGTGCGIQAMHASRFADRVVATDISARALEIAAMNVELNGIEGVEFRLGSLFDPVAGERFDRVVSNPPFVITPRREGVPEYDYRDGGMVGDGIVEAVITGVGEHLEPGGIAQLLGNWEYRGRGDAFDRVGEWLARSAPGGGALDHWVVERDVQHVTEYAETWIRDGGTRSGEDFDRLYDAWLDDFAARGVREVGFGYVLLRRPVDDAGEQTMTDASGAAREASARLARLERLHGPLGSDGATLGSHLSECLAAHDRQAALDDADLARSRLAVAPDVTEERHHWPGDENPTAMLLRQGGGFGRAITLDTGLAALVGACDGELEVGQIIAAIAHLLEVDAVALAAELLPAVRTLVDDGILRFAEGPGE